MLHRIMIVAAIATVACCTAGAEVFVGPQAPQQGLGIVKNPYFESGGMSYADHWRPMPQGVRIHRKQRETGGHSLFLELREYGEGGVTQTVDLPPDRTLSLRVLATSHSDAECSVVATLTRLKDRVVLAEVDVNGIERGVLAQAFETGAGGPAELMVRVVGDEGGRALIDRVTIARPVAAKHARRPDFSGNDLVLAPGEGLRVDADFEPRLLPAAARMLEEAVADLSGQQITGVGAAVTVSVDEPQATEWPQRESFRLTVDESGVDIAAPAEQGAMWAMMTLIDLVRPQPDGGARVLAVDVRDQPALPWRIGSDRGLLNIATVEDAARALARVKLNMALVPRDETGEGLDEAAAAALRDLGIEPLAVISGDIPGGPRAALEDARERFDATHFFVSPPLTESPAPGAPLPWGEEPLSEVARFAAEHRDEVTVVVPAAARTEAEVGTGVAGVAISFDNWPKQIVAAVYPSRSPEQGLDRLRTLDRMDVRSIVYHFGEFNGTTRALTARGEGINCMGALISPETAKAADLAWRGLPSRE